MTKQELKEIIVSLLDAAEDDNEWGGSETSNGVLMTGKVDWKRLRADIMKAVDSFANPAEQEPPTEKDPKEELDKFLKVFPK